MFCQSLEWFAVDAPQTNGAIFAGGSDALTVWTHGDRPYRSAVSLKGFDQLAFPTPQINAAV